MFAHLSVVRQIVVGSSILNAEVEEKLVYLHTYSINSTYSTQYTVAFTSYLIKVTSLSSCANIVVISSYGCCIGSEP